MPANLPHEGDRIAATGPRPVFPLIRVHPETLGLASNGQVVFSA